MKKTVSFFRATFPKLSGSQKVWLLLLFLTILSSFFCLFRLTNLPSELHRDETAIGYNAFSLLQTGKDEHGHPFPIIFTSYGDYKLPVLIYSTAISIRLLGLNVFAIRLPTVLFSIAFIPISYLFSYQLFQDRKKAVLVSLVVAFSFWHIYLSRTAYEPIVGLTLSTLSLYLLLRARQHPIFFLLCGGMFVFAALAYNIPMLLGPLFTALLLWIYRKDYFRQKSKFVSGTGIAFVFGAFILSFVLTLSATKGKTGTTLFSNSDIATQANRDFAAFIAQGVPYKISVALNNPYTTAIRQLIVGYFAVWNPNYLFSRGSESPWHSLHAIMLGDIQLGAFPFFLIGIWEFITTYTHRKQLPKSHLFLLWYFLLSPLINALTLDSPNTNRLLDFHFAVSICIALGMDKVFTLIAEKKFSYFLRMASTILFILFFASWLDGMVRYTLLHQYTLDLKWNEGIADAATFTAEVSSDVSVVYLDTSALPENNLLYSHFAFYDRIDPIQLQQAQWSKRYAFLAPDIFGKYQFTLPVDLTTQEPSTLIKYFPQNVETVVFVKRLVGNEHPSQFATHIVHDVTGKPLWEIAKVKKTQLQTVHDRTRYN